MEAKKNDDKSASKPSPSKSLEQTARRKMRDLKPEKDPMGGGAGFEDAAPAETER
jgi:hypothetical protein